MVFGPEDCSQLGYGIGTGAAVRAGGHGNQWNGSANNGQWSNSADWTTATPGAISGTTNADTTTFNAAGSAATAITVDAGRNLQNITFDTNAALGLYTFGSAGVNGGNALLLSAGGSILLNATTTTLVATETFNAPITLEGSYTFTNSQVQVGSKLVFAGNITNAAASTLTLSGAGTGNLISGIISNGGGQQSVTLSATAGTWTLSGANTYSGATTTSGAGTLVLSGSNSSAGVTTLSAGTMQLKSACNGGLASGVVTFTATANLQNALGSPIPLSNAFAIASSASNFRQ